MYVPRTRTHRTSGTMVKVAPAPCRTMQVATAIAARAKEEAREENARSEPVQSAAAATSSLRRAEGEGVAEQRLALA